MSRQRVAGGVFGVGGVVNRRGGCGWSSVRCVGMVWETGIPGGWMVDGAVAHSLSGRCMVRSGRWEVPPGVGWCRGRGGVCGWWPLGWASGGSGHGGGLDECGCVTPCSTWWGGGGFPWGSGWMVASSGLVWMVAVGAVPEWW